MRKHEPKRLPPFGARLRPVAPLDRVELFFAIVAVIGFAMLGAALLWM